MQNYNIVTLGVSGSGKTVFLASLFKQLSTSNNTGFILEEKDHQQRQELNNNYAKIIAPEGWPAQTTSKVTKWTFTCCVKTSNLDKYPVCQFTYIDYAGGLITDTLEDEESDFSDFQEGDKTVYDFQHEVPNADAVLAIIDGFKLLKFMQDKDLSTQDVVIWLYRDLPNIMQLVDKCKKDTPVHFIISKWDLLDSQYELSTLIEYLREKVPDFDNVVISRIKAGCPIRIIPISAIGHDFATLQPDGTMKKNPGAIPKPFQLEIPIACVLIDRVKAYMNTLEAAQKAPETSRQAKNNLFVLNNLIQSFLNKPTHLFKFNREDRLAEVENESTAINYLIGTFLEYLKKFEEDFPDAKLGGELIFYHSASPVPKPPPSNLPLETNTLNITLVHTLIGHKNTVCSVGFTANGQTIFSSSRDKTIRFWQTTSGQLQGRILEKSDWVRACLSQDDELLFTTCGDKTVKVWDAKTGKRLYKPIKAHSDLINSILVSPDGQTLVTGSRDKTVKIWQLTPKTNKMLNRLPHQGSIYTVAVSPDWRILASAGSDKKILLWELQNGNLHRTLEEHSGFIRSLAFSPDGKILISGGYEKILYIRDSQTMTMKYDLKDHTGNITCIAISPNNNILASGDSDCVIKIWDLSTGTLTTTLGGSTGHNQMITALAFSPDSQLLASGSQDNTVKIWQLM